MKNKTNEINIFSKLAKPSVLCFAEHWCKKEEIEKISLEGFTLASYFSRKNLKGGGVCIFTKENIVVSVPKIRPQLIREKDFEFCALELLGQNTFIICIYRSPDGDLEYFFNSLDEVLSHYTAKKSKIILCADLNINSLVPSKEKSKLYEMFASHNLKSLIDVPTRVTKASSTGLDYVATNLKENSIDVSSPGYSDHYGINVEFNAISQDKPIMYWSRNFSVPQIEKYSNFIENSNLTGMNCESLQNFLRDSCDSFFPLKKFSSTSSNKPWVTQEIRSNSKRLKELHKQKIISGSAESHQQYIEFKKLHRKMISTSKKTYNDQIISESQNKSKTIWNIVKKETNQSPRQIDKVINIRNKDDEPFADHLSQATFINNYFCGVGLDLQKRIPTTPRPTVPKLPHRFSLTPVTYEEVRKCISSLKNKSTLDINGLSTKIMKKLPESFIQKLTELINESFTSGIFPDVLKIAKVLPFYKGKGEKTKVENYRPISILPALSKVFEKLIKVRLMNYLIEHDILNKNQHGFLPGKSTETAILDFTKKIIDALDEKKKVSGVFLDLSKAFDTVDHAILIEKLEALGILGPNLDLFRSYLSGRKQTVSLDFLNPSTNTIETCMSPLLPVDIGVPQGSVLGPLLFLIYINDLCFSVPEENPAVLYADDTNCLFIHRSLPDLQTLAQTEIENLSLYFKQNRLTLNSLKTFIVDFCCRGPPDNAQLNIGADKIKNINSTKLLGVDIDSNLNWHIHTDNLSAKLNSICFAHRILSNSCSIEVLRIAYFAYFHSHLSYGIVFWGSQKQNLDKILIVQKKCIRIISNVLPSTPSKPLFKNLSILPVPCVYIYKCALLARSSKEILKSNSDIHSYNTRVCNNLHQTRANTSLKLNSPSQLSIKIYNALPDSIKSSPSLSKFKSSLSDFLQENLFYSVAEFFDKLIGLNPAFNTYF